MEEIRKMTGICPQHDVLFDELSPREHLQFFARIRVRFSHLFSRVLFFAATFSHVVDPDGTFKLILLSRECQRLTWRMR
jgi:hypothetical protein